MARTTADYLAALPAMQTLRPRGDDDPFAKVFCIKCHKLMAIDELDMDDPELDPTWCFCPPCVEAIEAVMPPEE